MLFIICYLLFYLRKLEMRKGTQKYLDYIENNSKIEFKIICILSCNGVGFLGEQEVKKGEIFNTNNYEFNYGGNYIRLFRNGKIIGLFNQENFMKIEDHRNKIIEDLIKCFITFLRYM